LACSETQRSPNRLFEIALSRKERKVKRIKLFLFLLFLAQTLAFSIPPQVLSSECEEEGDTKSDEKPMDKIVGEKNSKES
jgi:hypothetical protein